MTARRARAVRIRKGRYACYRHYEQRVFASWYSDLNNPPWLPRGYVEAIFPWLAGWRTDQMPFEVIMLPPTMSIFQPYEGEPVTFPIGGR